MIALLAASALAAGSVAAIRWLRVAQREHYLPGVARFARRWWLLGLSNRSLLALAALAVAVATLVPAVGLVAVGVAVIGPIGLRVRGRTSGLAWTPRLARLAGVVALLGTLAIAGAAFLDLQAVVVAVPLLVPLIVDLAGRIAAPFERRLGERWVAQAARTLERVAPTVVAITGSFGKTSTKNVAAHLLSGVRSVVASPASFNNRMGLARAVNEHLTPGTEVFIAEMGTYGPGEIRDLCAWLRPDVAVITALGPVHLERMGSLETIARAKREILEDAPVAVLSVDHPLLAEMAAEESRNRRVITASGHGHPADVTAGPDGRVEVGGDPVGSFDPDRAHPVNVACAIAVLVALGIDPRAPGDRLGRLPETPHRRAVGRSERGFDVIDDTFNANPEGARSALELLGTLGRRDGRRVVVTPGMVELGDEQAAANRAFCREAARVGVTDLVVVHRTNRATLLAGAKEAGIGSVIVFDTRDDAVTWVRETLVAGDAVLYENDLPDHYP